MGRGNFSISGSRRINLVVPSAEDGRHSKNHIQKQKSVINSQITTTPTTIVPDKIYP